ncbi:hypothetical protein [Agaribacterium sp. ZY112]|uniref:hypothetical protein n=1 Tax=Agaribacterium sp. ZY112 TaxID=3233574 RepID=UPI003526A039
MLINTVSYLARKLLFVAPYVLSLILGAGYFHYALANSIEQSPLSSEFTEDRAYVLPKDWAQVGEGSLKVLWFHIFDAKLYTKSGDYLALLEPKMDTAYTQTLVLQLTYQRGISKDRLLSETRKQLKSFSESGQIDVWISELAEIWPDIDTNDQLSIWVTEDSISHFYHSGDYIGSVEDKRFGPAFVSIWLSEQSSYPDLASELRGETQRVAF